MSVVYLGLGSNLNPMQNLAAGMVELAELGRICNESSWYQSPALGFDGPDFVNLVVALETDLTVTELASALKRIEFRFGRAADARKYSSRFLDIDILLYDDQVGEFGSVRLPRADIYRFAFVLKPLLEIAPDLCCPVSGDSMRDIWSSLSNQPLMLVDVEEVILAMGQQAV